MEENSSLVKRMVSEGKARKMNSFRAFVALFEKEQRIFLRDKSGFLVRISMVFSMIMFAAILYWQMGYDQSGIQNRKG